MSKRTVRILAIVALVFMVLFVAATIAWSFDRALFNGAIGYVAIFTGGLGIGIYVVLMLLRRAEARAAAGKDDVSEDAQAKTPDSQSEEPPAKS